MKSQCQQYSIGIFVSRCTGIIGNETRHCDHQLNINEHGRHALADIASFGISKDKNSKHISPSTLFT